MISTLLAYLCLQSKLHSFNNLTNYCIDPTICNELTSYEIGAACLLNALKLAAIDCSEVYDFVDSIKSEQVLLTIE